MLSPISAAAVEDGADRVEALIGEGADPDARDLQSWAPIHWAAGAGSMHAVVALARGGADLHAVTSAGETAAAIALDAGHAELADLIEDLGNRPAPRVARVATPR